MKSLLIRLSVLLLCLSLQPAAAEECVPCSQAERQAEYDDMVRRYQAAVEQARAGGYQCVADPNYSDPGDGNQTSPGNCADWAFVTWSALATQRWNCWDVIKIRARHKFAFWVFHNFVYIRPKCGGDRIIFDPYKNGRPDRWVEDAFPEQDGLWGGWIYYPLERHYAGDPPRTVQ